MEDCSNSIANALELLQSCTKPSIWGYHKLQPMFLWCLPLTCCSSVVMTLTACWSTISLVRGCPVDVWIVTMWPNSLKASLISRTRNLQANDMAFMSIKSNRNHMIIFPIVKVIVCSHNMKCHFKLKSSSLKRTPDEIGNNDHMLCMAH